MSTGAGRTTITDEDLDIQALRPIGDYVLIKLFEPATKTRGGLHLVRGAVGNGSECALGEVVAVGRGVWNDCRMEYFPIELEKGENVLIMQYAGDRIELRDGKYRMVHSRWVAAKVVLKNKDTYEVSQLIPRMDHVALMPRKEEQSKGGILYVQGLSDSKNRAARVVAVGPGLWHSETGKRLPVPLEPDDEVVFGRYLGADVPMADGRLLRLVMEGDIVCKGVGIYE